MHTLSPAQVAEVSGGISFLVWVAIANVAYDFSAGFAEGMNAAGVQK
jgi:hypothetical protein